MKKLAVSLTLNVPESMTTCQAKLELLARINKMDHSQGWHGSPFDRKQTFLDDLRAALIEVRHKR